MKVTVCRRACLALVAASSFATAAHAAPVTYRVDPTHTFPSFEADHMGISTWRGKMNKTEGEVMLDKAAGNGWVDIKIDMGSIDFGQSTLNGWARGKNFFDIETNPYAFYKGRLESPRDGMPTKVVGELSINGRAKPVELEIHSLKCIPHPLFKREVCGADASGKFNREDFGLDYGKQFGFRMDVLLRIQVEAIAKE
jgi:polyisoprenoid-binding protein YceI